MLVRDEPISVPLFQANRQTKAKVPALCPGAMNDARNEAAISSNAGFEPVWRKGDLSELAVEKEVPGFLVVCEPLYCIWEIEHEHIVGVARDDAGSVAALNGPQKFLDDLRDAG